MTWYAFGPSTCIDDNGYLVPVQTAGQVFDTDDAAFATPLPVTDAAGVALAGQNVIATSTGVLAQFLCETPNVRWKSGNVIVGLSSTQGLTEAAVAAQSAAESAAASAQSAADQAALATAPTEDQIDTYLGGSALNLVQTVAAKADLDPATGKLVLAQLPDGGTVPGATAAARGVIKLVGDLGGTADAPTVPALASKADKTTVVPNTGDSTISGTKTFTSAPVIPDASLSIAKTAGLQDALNDAASSGGSGDPALGGALTGTASNASIAAGAIADAAIASNANIAQSKIAGLASTLGTLVPVGRQIAGLNLTADRSAADLASALGALSLANLPPGATFDVVLDGSDWKYAGATITARPTSRTDVVMQCVGATSTPPAWAITGDRLLRTS